MSILFALLFQATGQVISPPLPPPARPPLSEAQRAEIAGREAVYAQLFLIQHGSDFAVGKMLEEAKRIPVRGGPPEYTDLAALYSSQFMADDSILAWFDCRNASDYELSGDVDCVFFTGAEGQAIDRRGTPTHRLRYKVKDHSIVEVAVISVANKSERG